MPTKPASTSPSPAAEPAAEPAGQAAHPAGGAAWPPLPTETEIYLLPDGSVVIADLPVELAALAAALGAPESCAVSPHGEPTAAV